jgi:hypothetical protein
MGKTSSLMLLLLGTLVSLVASTALVSMPGQSQSGISRNDKAQQRIEFESRFPVADYSGPEPADPKERAKRKSKDHRFPEGRLDESPGVTETLILDGNGSGRLPALPVGLSDLIIVGDVLNAHAYLSSTKTGTFSEFTVSIQEVLKTTSSDPVLPGANISVEREGARIRYPSGQVRLVRFAHEGMPAIGGRYVLFLRRTEEEPYVILKGYELRVGRVFPIDDVAAFNESELPKFAVYEGVEETVFLTKVRDLLN